VALRAEAAAADELKSNADVQRRLVVGLAPLMRRHGFRALKRSSPFKPTVVLWTCPACRGQTEVPVPGEERHTLEFRAHGVDLVQARIIEISRCLEQVNVPPLERCSTLAALESLVNRPPGDVPLFRRTRLGITLAHCIGSPHFDEIVAQQLAQAEGDWSRGRIRELVAVLGRMKDAS